MQPTTGEQHLLNKLGGFMKKKLLMVLAILACVIPNGVYAKGTTTVDVTGKNNVTVGETFTVDIVIKDVEETNDGVVAFGGRLSFDESKLKLVDVKLSEEPYQFDMNEKTYKLAGVDFTLENGIYNETVIYTFTFKAISSGNTTVSINELKLTDSIGYIDGTINNLSLNIKDEIIPTETTTTKTTTTTRTTRKNTTTNKVTEKSTTKNETTSVITTTKEVKENINTTKNVKKQENKKTITTVIKNIFNSIIESVERLFKRK